MSIKVVDEIPGINNKISYNSMIRKDFEEAIENHINKFEFEGDYNYKTLAASARNQARTMFKPIFRKTAREVEEIVGAELGRKIWVTSDWDYRDKYISIMSRKADDRIHVYAEIDYEFIENFKEILLADTRALEKRRDAERKALEKRG